MSAPASDVPVPAPPPPGRWSLRGADGSVRPGWALLLFVALAGVAGMVEFFFSAALYERLLVGLQLGDLIAWPLVTARAGWVGGITWICCHAVGWRFGDANLRDRRWPVRFAQGAALGGGALSLAVLGPLAFGHERFTLSGGGAGRLAASLLWAALTCASIAFSEELLVRGFALRQLERWLGRWGAAVATAVAFGLLHLFNWHVTWLAVGNIVLCGLWLAIIVQRTGSLWLATGLHFAWNLTQGFVWGEPVSGFPVRASLLFREPPGDVLWTGGNFGPEGSVFTTLVLGGLTLLFALWPRLPPENEAALDQPRDVAR